MDKKTDILTMYLPELEEYFCSIGEKSFRAKQIFEWLHTKRVFDFSKMTNISTQLKTTLEKDFCINKLNILKKLESRVDDTVKYLYGLNDCQAVEAVLMKHNHGNSLCISTQVGCKMGCSFCASTKAGFVRNLSPSEMLMQLYQSEDDSKRKVNSIVLMGIGEPLDNYDNVIRFLYILRDGAGMSLRNVSLSTCGIVPKIYELAKLKLGVTLSVSLHCANDDGRSKIMPINTKYSLLELMQACKDYFKETVRRISFEYSLIDGVNDDYKSASQLIGLLKGFPCHVNLIPINPIKERNFKKSKSSKNFQKALTDAGINATIRRTLGQDIQAACGQLRAEEILINNNA